jgi:hypothetical protein
VKLSREKVTVGVTCFNKPPNGGNSCKASVAGPSNQEQAAKEGLLQHAAKQFSPS